MSDRDLKQSFLDFLADEAGHVQIEEALIVTLVSVGIIGASVSNGDALASLYEMVAHEVDPPPLVDQEETR